MYKKRKIKKESDIRVNNYGEDRNKEWKNEIIKERMKERKKKNNVRKKTKKKKDIWLNERGEGVDQ